MNQLLPIKIIHVQLMLKIIKPGIFTTIQDRGRFGYKKFGVPNAGAMDQRAMSIANQIVRNSANSAVIEFMLNGPRIEFIEPIEFVITGCEVEAKLNNSPLLTNRLHSAQQGDILSLERVKSGLCGYLAVRGGFKSDRTLGSMSFYPNITEQTVLETNQLISFANTSEIRTINDPIESFSNCSTGDPLVIWKGPEFDQLSPAQIELFLSHSFKISPQISRMGFRTELIKEMGTNEIITGSVQPGTIQATPAGELILLMRDAPATGGYARIGLLSEDAINCLAQKRPNETVSFEIS